MKRFVVLVLMVVAFFLPVFVIRADELDDITKQLEALKADLQGKEANYQKLNTQLEGIKSRVSFLEAEIVTKEKEVKQGEKVLSYQKNLLNERAKSYYKNINKSSVSLVNLLVSDNLSVSLKNFFYQKTVVDQDRNAIIKIVLYIKNLEQKKAELQSEKTRLASVKEEIDRQSKVLAGEITTTKQKIAQLSERQQSLIASRLASLNIPRSAGTSARGCSDDRGVDPGFSPRFAFFTFGAPHRVGMNQYGAKGRADAGQGRDDILRAYYQNFEITKWDTNIKIKVQGQGEFSLEDYTLRIYEMPEDWPMPALEAQAIAARSFALAYTNNGSGEICTSESCQVFRSDPKTGAWAQAVKNTEGMVMTNGGSPIKAWYASTHGGYVFSSSEVWGGGTSYTKHATDTTTGSAGGFGDVQSNAYDRSSPWFYCDWGARGQYSNTAWLKPSEVADIVNVILLARADSSTGEHLYQTDKPHPYGGEVWDEARVKDELKKRGTSPFSNVSDLSIGADFGYGKTNSVSASGDAGSTSFSGDEFKSWFNLRAPVNIQIVGPLYNIEKR